MFLAAPGVHEWVTRTFLKRESTLYNPDHDHLNEAHIGFLWTNVENRRQMRRVIATAEDPNPAGGSKWKNARAEQQLREWFGAIPDFLITLYAPFLVEADNRTFCAIIEHELYHCAQKLDEFGSPKFQSDGLPAFAIRGHDVEEFIGVATRYGMTADIKKLFDAVSSTRQVSDRAIDGVCGTCLRVAA